MGRKGKEKNKRAKNEQKGEGKQRNKEE